MSEARDVPLTEPEVHRIQRTLHNIDQSVRHTLRQGTYEAFAQVYHSGVRWYSALMSFSATDLTTGQFLSGFGYIEPICPRGPPDLPLRPNPHPAENIHRYKRHEVCDRDEGSC